MTSHKKRLITSFILLPLVAWIILFGSKFFLQLLIFCVSGIALYEFVSFFDDEIKTRWFKYLLVLLIVPLVFNNMINFSLTYLLIVYFWIFNLSFLFLFGLKDQKIPWTSIQLGFLGIIYIPFVLQFFQDIPRKEIVLVLGVAIISDTCAYYSGTFWGKKKLWPKISPKKTWMGAIGSMVGCLIFTLFYGTIFLHAPLLKLIILGIILNLGAQSGDLFESALKRYLQIKDSGSILPGHGGIMDRIDSLLLVCPIYLIYTRIFGIT